MDDNNELIIYVLRQLRYGVPEQAIRETLVQNGWPLPLIDRAFSMVQKAQPHDVAPTGQALPDSSQTQGMSLPTAQPLPTTAGQPEMLRPALPQPTESDQEPSNSGRRLLIALTVLFALAVLGFGAYFLYKATHQSQEPAVTTAQTTADKDNQRKKDIRALASKLSQYYSTHQTYPTLEQINSDNFSSSSKGFAISKFKDPGWNNQSTNCKNDQGSVVFSPQRAEDCYAYRATALNGSDCDANGVPCTRVVLTADLEGDQPFIVALDRNRQE